MRSTRFNTRSFRLCASALMVYGPWLTLAHAQQAEREPSSFVNQQRAIQEQVRSDADREWSAGQKISFDFGGWYSAYFATFDDNVQQSRSYQRHDLRLWTRLSLNQGIHEFYLRSRAGLQDFGEGDSYDGDQSDVEGPNLERGYYRIDISRALSEIGADNVPGSLELKVGRDLVQFGTGFALASSLDHVDLSWTVAGLRIRGLAGKTVGSSDDFDLSRSAERNHRDFAGLEITYVGFDRHEPFAYAFSQHDRNHEKINTTLQRFDYDSTYFGIGSRGELVQGLSYSAEAVFEIGHSYGDGQSTRANRIEAWGLDAQLTYLFPGKRRGRLSAEYMFGSGDRDRRRSPTDSIGGNENDYVDSSFVGFGWRDTGLSLAPRYSNLHVWRAGGSFYPWPESDSLAEFEVGTDWFLYYKHHRAAAISDPTASIPSGYVGCEMDYFINWEIVGDLSWTARCGVFFPGDAYEERSARAFLLTGLIWSF